MLTIFGWNFEIEERCKGVHCVDLGESFPTSIYLQKSASIQPRTSPSKFGGNYSILFNRVLTREASGSALRIAARPRASKNKIDDFAAVEKEARRVAGGQPRKILASRSAAAWGRGGSVKIKSQGWQIKWALRGSFSAVSTPIFARKYSLESSWRDLQDLHAFAPLRPQYFCKFSSWIFYIFSQCFKQHRQNCSMFVPIRAETSPNFVRIAEIFRNFFHNPHTENLKEILGFFNFATKFAY